MEIDDDEENLKTLDDTTTTANANTSNTSERVQTAAPGAGATPAP